MAVLPMKGKAKDLKYTLAIFPLDCMGCGVCVEACPADALDHGRREARWLSRTCSTTACPRLPTSPRSRHHAARQPVQAAAARVLRRLCRLRPDGLRPPYHAALRRPHVHLQRHRLLLHLGRTGWHVPYTVNKQGHGPAWSNSLFEDNAEHGMGMLLGYEAVNNMLSSRCRSSSPLALRPTLPTPPRHGSGSRRQAASSPKPPMLLVESFPPSLLARRSSQARPANPGQQGLPVEEVHLDLRRRRLGLRHRLTAVWTTCWHRAKMNIFVFDTEVSFNTGGQASKASNNNT